VLDDVAVFAVGVRVVAHDLELVEGGGGQAGDRQRVPVDRLCRPRAAAVQAVRNQIPAQ
jgi:hypothetical protein